VIFVSYLHTIFIFNQVDEPDEVPRDALRQGRDRVLGPDVEGQVPRQVEQGRVGGGRPGRDPAPGARGAAREHLDARRHRGARASAGGRAKTRGKQKT